MADDSLEIPEEIVIMESERKKRNHNYGPPIDTNIFEDLPVTESMEMRERNK